MKYSNYIRNRSNDGTGDGARAYAIATDNAAADIETANGYRAAMDMAAETLDDNTALDCMALYREWKPGIWCEAGERLRYGDNLYRCEQSHTSQDGWEPPNVPALWTHIAKPGEIPVWVQPTGAQDAYMTGDRVHYPDADGPVYVSTVDYNVYAPGVYGWEVIT